MTNDPTVFVSVFASIATILGAWFLIARLIAPLVKRARTFTENIEHFIRDWSGTDSEPGRDRVPGVMERLNDIDGQLKNNGGSSVKDTVDRIEIRVNEIDIRLVDGDKRFDDIYNEIKSIKKDFY